MLHNLVHGLTHQKRVVGKGDADPGGPSADGQRCGYATTLRGRRSRCSQPVPRASENCCSAVLVFVCCWPDRSMPARARNAARLGRDLEHLRRVRTWSRARGSASRRDRATSRCTSLRPKPAGVELSLSTKIGPSSVEVVELEAGGRVLPRRTRRCGLVNSLRVARLPRMRFFTSAALQPRLHATPSTRSRRASRRAPRPSRERARSSSGSSSGTTGRSLTTRRPRGPARAARARSRPARLSRRSGVSKNQTSRICASSGSRPSASIAERCAGSGTVSFSSTLSAPDGQREHLPEILVAQLDRLRRVGGGHDANARGQRRVTAPHPARVVAKFTAQQAAM